MIPKLSPETATWRHPTWRGDRDLPGTRSLESPSRKTASFPQVTIMTGTRFKTSFACHKYPCRLRGPQWTMINSW